MSYNLFLDDERRPRDAVYWETIGGQSHIIDQPLLSWMVVKSYHEFVNAIKQNGVPKVISFDHDLHPEHYVEGRAGIQPRYGQYKEKTGYECLQWLVEHCKQTGIPLPKCYVHTFNPRGRENMFALIESYNESKPV